MPQPKIPRMPADTFNRLFGSPAKLSKDIGAPIGTVCMWRRRGVIPAHHVERIEIATGVPKHLIRPDIFNTPKVRRRA